MTTSSEAAGSLLPTVVLPKGYWCYFWDYADGNITDQGTHLMEVVQMFTKSGPLRSAIMNGLVAKMTGAEHPDVFCAVCEYPEFLAPWTLNYSNSYQNGWSITFQGDKGTMILDDEGYRESPVPIESHIQNFLDCVRSRQEPNCNVEIAAEAVTGSACGRSVLFQEARA